MAITVSPLNILGNGIPVITTFADSLATTDFSNTIGFNNNWLLLRPDYGQAAGTPGWNKWSMAQPLSDLSTGMISIPSNEAGPTYHLASALVPWKIIPGVYSAKQSFAQVTFVQSSGAAGDGFIVFGNFESPQGATGANNPSFNGYYLRIDVDATHGHLVKLLNTTGQTVLSGALSIPNGSVCRLSCDASNSAQTVITVNIGGTISTFTDNTATRLNHGFPCFFDDNINTQTLQWKVWSCGVGL